MSRATPNTNPTLFVAHAANQGAGITSPDPGSKPWDTPGLPPRPDRCRFYRGLCAYRDDAPARCALCHAAKSSGKCVCTLGPHEIGTILEIVDAYANGERLDSLVESTGIPAREISRFLGIDARKANA